jgi:excinuclease ABC subunit C
MHQCLGPCIRNIDQNAYTQYIQQVHDFFGGNIKEIVTQLEISEETLSNNMNFEEAQKTHETIKDLLRVAKILKESQLVFLKSNQTVDVIGYVISNNTICITIFSYIDGKLLLKNNQICDLYGQGEEEILNYLFQYYDNNKNLPANVYISLPNNLLKQLTNQLKINFINPLTGKYKTIIKNAMDNARKSLASNYLVYKNKFNRSVKAYEDFKTLIGNSQLSLIHIFDISNLFSENKVGAMVVLENGNFNKSSYKKFIIKDANSISDTQCMREVIQRQYSRAINENKKLPGLIIVDGGKHQVNVCKDALHLCKLNIQVIGLAKNSKHQTDKIVFENGTEYKIPINGNVYQFLLNIQEEVHRFAISFFKQKKIKQLFNSQLDNIPGVGQKTIKKLLDFYGSIDNIKKANISEIEQLVDKKTAKLIKTILK